MLYCHGLLSGLGSLVRVLRHLFAPDGHSQPLVFAGFVPDQKSHEQVRSRQYGNYHP